MLLARADLFAMSVNHKRDYVALQQEVLALRREVAELRALAGVRDPRQLLQ
jgi:hypothetical protein